MKEMFAGLGLKRETVEVDGVGTVYVQEMSLSARDAFETAWAQPGGKANQRALLLIATVCDESGAPVFAGSDLETVRRLPAAVMEPVVEAAMKLNGLLESDLEDAVKN